MVPLAVAEYGGLALFFLVYVYAWTNCFRDIRPKINTQVTASSDSVNSNKIFWTLNAFAWQLLAMEITVMLIIVVLICTCFRALSSSSRGTLFDTSLLRYAFSWIVRSRLINMLSASKILIVFLITMTLIIARISSRQPPKNKRGRLTAADVFVPRCDESQAYVCTVEAVLMLNLVTIALSVIIVYADTSLGPLMSHLYRFVTRKTDRSDLARLTATRRKQNDNGGLRQYREKLKEARALKKKMDEKNKTEGGRSEVDAGAEDYLNNGMPQRNDS